MRWALLILLLVLLALQYQLWVGKGSRAEIAALRREIAAQQTQMQSYRVRNDELRAEVESLKKDLDAVEERARSDLGMISKNELFFQILEPDKNREQ